MKLRKKSNKGEIELYLKMKNLFNVRNVRRLSIEKPRCNLTSPMYMQMRNLSNAHKVLVRTLSRRVTSMASMMMILFHAFNAHYVIAVISAFTA